MIQVFPDYFRKGSWAQKPETNIEDGAFLPFKMTWGPSMGPGTMSCSTPHWNLRVNLFYLRDNSCQILDQCVTTVRQLFIVQMPQAFSQPVLSNPLQRWLKGNGLKPLPPHLRLSLLCLLRSVRAWGRGPCCGAVLGPAALMGVGEPLCSAFPSLHSVTSHCQLEIGQGGVFTQWKSVNCYKWRLFFPWRTGC